jgi:hypothetical protein
VLRAPSRAAYLENVAWFGEEVVARYAPRQAPQLRQA